MKNSKFWKIVGCCAALALVMVGAVQTARASVATGKAIDVENDVVVDYITETVTVMTTDDEYIYFTDDYHDDVERWEVCEVRDDKAVFDISWISTSKEVRLYLCGDEQVDVVAVDLNWMETLSVDFTGTLVNTDITEAAEWKTAYKLYPNFSEDTGYLIFTLNKKNRETSYFNLANIEWRKGENGVWRAFSELDLREMNIMGIKLHFRIKATTGERTSKVAKVSISKLNPAPRVEVNTDTMMLNIKNGQEYSFDKENWVLVPTYSKKYGTDKYRVTEAEREPAINDIYTNVRVNGILIQHVLGVSTNTEITEDVLGTMGFDYAYDEAGEEIGVIVYVRDAADDDDAASKVVELVVPYTDPNLSKPSADHVAIEYGESKTGTGGIVVTNNSDYKYQVGVITKEEYQKISAKPGDIDVSQIQWTSIKAGKSLKISSKKATDGCYIIYRIAGEKGQLPSTYLIEGPFHEDAITYAGIASAKKDVGDVLVAVASTNVKIGVDAFCQWQRCTVDDFNSDAPDWQDIAGEIDGEYTLTEDDVDCYVRVVITDKYSTSMESEPVGPIKGN